ncbi:hypothetical protein FB451DRAFT_1407102 [Mycena latifolia]|nr:hypothetical protein FB451DRAFT_1407102 [Mycena latifolia]
MDIRPVKYLLGPPFVHMCMGLVLQGILSAQFVTYFGGHRARADPVAMKVFVWILVVMTFAECIQTISRIRLLTVGVGNLAITDEIMAELGPNLLRDHN